ncbi:MAG: BlaI/MecI/CopY family transcriptional regulator [Acidobacteriota bacterium]
MIGPIVSLPRRERELLEALLSLRKATAAELSAALADPPGNSAVRALLARLESKGHITHQEEEGRYVYQPLVARRPARDSALRQIVKTFFDGSPASAAAALIGMSRRKLTAEEIVELQEMLDAAKKETK